MNDYVAIWYDRDKQSISWIGADQPHPTYAVLVAKQYATALYAFVDVDVEARQAIADFTSLMAAMADAMVKAGIVLPEAKP